MSLAAVVTLSRVSRRLRELETRLGAVEGALRGSANAPGGGAAWAPARAPAAPWTSEARAPSTAPEEAAPASVPPEADVSAPDVADPAPAGRAAAGAAAPARDGGAPATPLPVPPGPEPAPAADRAPEADDGDGGDDRDGGRGVSLTGVLALGGGLAVASAAVFGVRELAERGVLGPELRIAGGALIGLVLLAAGEWVGRRSRPVAAALGGAGVVALYATVLAATRLYGFLDVAVGTAGLVAVTAAAIALSLRRGLLLAIVGLVGGFATPAVLGADAGSPPLLFGYLLLLQAALLATARGPSGWIVAALTVPAAWVWVAIAVALPGTLGPAPEVAFWALAHVLGASAALAVWALAAGDAPDAALRRWVAVPSVAVGAVLAATLVSRADFAPVDWGLFAALGVGVLVLARRDRRFAPLPPVTAAVTAVLTIAFVVDGSPGAPGWVTDLVVALGVCTLWALGPLGLVRVGGAGAAPPASTAGDAGAETDAEAAAAPGPAPRSDRRAAVFAATAAALFSALAVASIFAWLEQALPEWGRRALGAGFALGVAGAVVARGRRSGDDGVRAALVAGAATTAVLGVTTAVPTEGWSLALPALVALYAFLAGRLGEPGLRRVAVGATVLAALTLLVGAAEAPDPFLDLLPWNLVSWAAVAAALAYAAIRTADDGAPGRTVAFFEASALAALAGALWVAVRTAFGHGDEPFDGLGVVEAGLVLSLELALAVAARGLGRRIPSTALAVSGLVLGGVTLLALVLGPLTAGLPVVTGDPVGGLPVLNGLVVAYFLPAATLLGAAWVSPDDPRWARVALRLLALLLVFAGVTLEVRHAFHAPDLAGGAVRAAEHVAYSLAWVGLAVALFLVALRTGSQLARFASFTVFVVTAIKVSVVDTAELDGLLRIAAWLFLGLALLGIAYLDRLVPRSAPRRGPTRPEEAP